MNVTAVNVTVGIEKVNYDERIINIEERKSQSHTVTVMGFNPNLV